MKKSQLLNFFRVTLLLLIFSAFTTSAWAESGFFSNGAANISISGSWKTEFNSSQVADFALGTVTSAPTIDDTWVKVWGDGAITQVYFGYKVDGVDKGEIASVSKSGGGDKTIDWNSLNITLPSTSGAHTIEFWYRSNTNVYLSNNSSNYKITYTIAGAASTTYHAKYPWDGGNNWYWKEFDENNQIEGTFRGGCMNVDTSENNNASCIVVTGGSLNNGDPCIFTYNPSTNKVTATPTGGSGDTPSGNLPTSKGECQKIEIYSKNNYNLYVFKDGSPIGPNWEYTQEGESVSYDGSPYYKWTICKQDNVQIIFRNSERNKQSGNSPVLYGGYKYFFEEDVEVVENGNSNPIPNPKSYKEIEIEDCSTTGACYNFVCEIEDEDVNVPELPAGIVCDASNKKILFFEDFGKLSSEDSRKQNNKVDSEYSDYCGIDEFVTSYNYVSACAKIKQSGSYAIVANPRYSGCSKDNDDVENTCDCNPANNRLWYKDCLDHTEGDVNGGMLQFDCRNGSYCDVLYQRTLSNVCENTFLNFSAWVKKANVSTDSNDKINALFLLRKGGGDGQIIGKKEVKEIDLNDNNLIDGWKQISAMFNTGMLDNEGKKITVQLINLAPYGQNGNDILLDDLELAACTPKAELRIEGGGTNKELNYSESVILEAKITEGIIDTPYFYWQSRSKTQGSSWSEWLELHDKNGLPVSGVSSNKITVTPESPHTEYRVIIVPSEKLEDNISKVLENLQNEIPCGMYAITNTVTLNVYVKDLILTPTISDGDICVDGEDENTLTFTVENTTGITVSNVKVKVNIPTEVTSVSVAEGSGYSNGVWTIGTIANNATAELKLTLKSATTLAVASKDVTINSFISGINSLTYNTYEDALVKKETILTLNQLPIASLENLDTNICNGNSSSLNINVSKGNPSYTINYKKGTTLNTETLDAAGQLNISDALTQNTIYTLESVQDSKGCAAVIDDNTKATVSVNPRPELLSFKIEDADIICAGTTTKLVAEFSGEAPFAFEINGQQYKTTEKGTYTEKDGNKTWTLELDNNVVNAAGKYKFTLTNLSDANCSSETLDNNEVTLEVEALPVIKDVPTEVELNCSQTTATIKASNASTYKWFYKDVDGVEQFLKDGSELSLSQTDVNIAELTTVYTVYGYSEKANCKSKDAITLTVKEDFVKPIVEITAPTDILTCTQTSIDLTVDATNNTENIVEYIWDGGAASSSSTYPITSQGNHTLKVKGENGCYSDEATKNITQNINKPTISIKSYDSPSTSESVNRVETQVVTCTNSTLYLETTVDEITDPNKVGYSWSNGSEKFSTEVSSAGTYTVIVTDKANGCTQTASIDITKDDSAANISKISSITTLDESSENYKETTELTCTVTSLILNPSVSNVTSASYEWSKLDKETGKYNNIGGEKNQTVNEPGDYKLVVIDNDNGCSAEEYITITQNINKPTISIKSYDSPSTSESVNRVETQVVTCTNSTLYLETTVDEITDPNKVGYSWSNGDGDFSTEVSSAGTYTVIVTDKANGCTQTASIDITKDDSAANISKISSITTLDESSENYKETTELTCAITSLILNPSVSNVTSASYEWNKLDKVSGEYNKIGGEKNQTVNEPGDYKLVVIDNDNGCSAEEYITITQNINKPEISIKSYDSPSTSESVNRVETQVVTCTNSTLYLETTVSKITDSDEIGYSWSNGSEKFSTEVSSAGTYTVIVTDKANGCTQTASIEITKDVNAATISGISSVTTLDESSEIYAETTELTCAITSLILNPSVSNVISASYEWSKLDKETGKYNKIGGEKNQTVNEPGDYKLVVIDNDNGCSAEEYITITQNINKPEISIKSYDSPSTSESVNRVETQVVTCTNSTLYLETTVSKITDSDEIGYSWSNGSEKFSTEVSSAGTYTVIVTDKANGCTQTASIEITKDVNAATISGISSVTTLDESSEIYAETTELTCAITSLILNPAVSNVTSASYEWSKFNKETGKYNKIGSELTQTITEKGVYKFVVTDNATGCTTYEEVTITENKRTPIIEDIISVNSTDETAEGYQETQVINCRDTELFISSVIKDKVETKYSPEELEYDWTVSYDNGEIFEEYGEAATITAKEKAIFRLVVTDKVTGCPAVADSIHIKEVKTTPIINSVTSSSVVDPEAAGAVLTNVITCAVPELYLRPNVNDSEGNEYENTVSYKWNDGSTKEYLKVSEAGTYSVIVTDNTTFCSAEEFAYEVTENKRTPIIEDIISVNSTDETVEGYKETQIINCKDTELFISSVIKDKVETQYSPEELEYDWTVSYDNGEIFEEYGEAATITATAEAIFRLVVKDEVTGCPAEAKTIEITEVKTTPTIKSMTSVSTIDPEAEKVEETNVLTCEYPVLYLKPTIESENEVSYKWNDESTLDYLKVEEKGTYTLIVKDETTFCSSEVYSYDVSENKNAPVLDIQSVYELCPSDTLSAKTLSSLLPNVAGVTYKFYDESGEEIADVYEVSSESSVNSYYVIGTSANGCSSEKALFDVDFAKNVDFTLTASQTSMMIGGNETVVTITPDADSDIATSYIWTANGEEIDVDGLEFVDNLYIDTNFKVTASNRCDSDTKEAFIEVLWPTAFTPHNGNGKNDDFAKGMHIIVFNRFYTKIFEGPDGWDGTINGAMNESESIAVPGVYYYSVQLPNGEVKKGTIEIVKVD